MTAGQAPGLPPVSLPASYNLAFDLLRRRRDAGDGAKVAYCCPDRNWTFGEVAAEAARVSGALSDLGVRREERVLIALPDSAEFVATFLGTLLAGAVAVPCNTFLGHGDYRYFLAESRAAVFVTTAAIAHALAPAIAEAADLTAVLVTDAHADHDLTHAWTRWVEPQSPEVQAVHTHRDSPAFWLWTSGSTGVPKAAVHLHQDWPWCCEGFGVGVLELTAGDRLFSAAKLFHAYGLGNGLAFPFWVGATTALLPARATPDAVFDVMRRHRPTVFFGVPTLYAALVQRAPADTAAAAGSLRLAVSAGEPLPADLYLRWREVFGAELLDAIGSTEVLHCYLSPRPGHVRPGSVGQPVPGYAVRIVDERGDDVPAGGIGELLVHGQSTAVTYWQRREQTAEKMRGPWFRSGDQYRVDDDGYYWHIGRADDMFKVSGEWCSATEVEAALAGHPAVLECAVVPQADASGVLKPRAVVVTVSEQAGSDALADELREFVRGRLARYKVPRTIEFVRELPKTATGKIQRYKLRG